MRRARIPTARVFCILAALAGCNGILGIEEGHPRDGGLLGDGATGDGDPTGDGSSGDAGTDGSSDVQDVQDGGFDGFIPEFEAGAFSCTPAAVLIQVSSTATGKYGPSLTYATSPNLWALVWVDNNAGTNPNNFTVRYNAYNGSARLFASSNPPLTPSGNYSNASLANLGGAALVVAVGAHDAGNAYATARSVYPLDAGGGPFVRAANHTTTTVPPEIGGIAVTSATNVVVASRGGTGNPTELNQNDFNLPNNPGITSPVAPTTRASAIVSTPNGSRVALAYIDSNVSEGKLTITNPPVAKSFASMSTTTQDQPAIASGAIPGVAIVSAFDRFAIAWVDARKSATEIWLTIVDAQGVRATSVGAVQVSKTSSYSKFLPQLAFNGETIGVSWTEQVTASDYNVMFRRYSLNLVNLENDPMTASFPKTTQLTVSGIAAGPNKTYGVAFADTSQWLYLDLPNCTGP